MSEQAPAYPANRSNAELRGDIERNRAELAATLDALEYKLNVPRQLSAFGARATGRFRDLTREKPWVVIGTGAGAAILAVAGAAAGITAIVNSVRDRD